MITQKNYVHLSFIMILLQSSQVLSGDQPQRFSPVECYDTISRLSEKPLQNYKILMGQWKSYLLKYHAGYQDYADEKKAVMASNFTFWVAEEWKKHEQKQQQQQQEQEKEKEKNHKRALQQIHQIRLSNSL
jgi:hypothetical protein